MKNNILIIISIFLCSIAPPVSAHPSEENPIKWCSPNLIKDDQSVNATNIGQFPGPSQHKLMDRVDIAEFPLLDIPALSDRNMRARFWVLRPGGVIADHCHENRPAMVYLISGEVIETYMENGKPLTRELKAGNAVSEGNGTRHWWKNVGKNNVYMFAVDIPKQAPPIHSHNVSNTSNGAKQTILQQLDLSNEYPNIPDAHSYSLQTRRIEVKPNGVLGNMGLQSDPAIIYVINGTFLEHRTDTYNPVVRQTNSSSVITKEVSSSWLNISKNNGELIIIEFKKNEGERSE